MKNFNQTIRALSFVLCLALAGGYSSALEPLRTAYAGGPYNLQLAHIYCNTAMLMKRYDLAIQPAMAIMATKVGQPDELLYWKHRVMSMVKNVHGDKLGGGRFHVRHAEVVVDIDVDGGVHRGDAGTRRDVP